MKIQESIANADPKILRMSAVALSAAVMGVIWAFADALISAQIPAIVVSSVTALVMLIAQFVDVRAKAGGAEVFHGEGE